MGPYDSQHGAYEREIGILKRELAEVTKQCDSRFTLEEIKAWIDDETDISPEDLLLDDPVCGLVAYTSGTRSSLQAVVGLSGKEQ